MNPRSVPLKDEEKRQAERPVDASMTLLNMVMERALDPGYAEATERKAEKKNVSGRTPSKIITVTLLAVLAALITVAVISLRTPQQDVDEARALLETNITERSDELATRKDSVELLEGEIKELQQENLSLPGQRLLEASAKLGVATGGTAVEGTGIVIEMRDSKSEEGPAIPSSERVQDFDLQIVVNGLWAAGAEAISINGHRVTTLSAIRSAGEAILVDFSPLQTPYVIEAIGEPNRLETGIAANQAGAHMQLLSSTYNIGISTKSSDHLELASGTDSVRYAEMEISPQDIPLVLSGEIPQTAGAQSGNGGSS